MGQSHSTSSSSPRPITAARKHKVSRQDSLLETPALWDTVISGNASNFHSEETVIPIQELRPAPPPNRRPSYIPAVLFSPHDIRTPTQQTTANGRRRSLPGVRRAPRLVVAHPPVLHDDESDTDQGSDNGNSDTDGDLQSICSSSHTAQIDRPKTPLTDRPPTPWADASDSENEEPPISPLSPKQPPPRFPLQPPKSKTSSTPPPASSSKDTSPATPAAATPSGSTNATSPLPPPPPPSPHHLPPPVSKTQSSPAPSKPSVPGVSTASAPPSTGSVRRRAVSTQRKLKPFPFLRRILARPRGGSRSSTMSWRRRG